ncbi:MAG: hypothetical protein Q7K45_02260, partial [Nanoarchaeota archaeon]|nr:hypothetical protein [Nanoarchaeota archaeon]
MKILSIGTDRKLFEPNSAVRLRQIENAKKYDELHIIVMDTKNVTHNSAKPVADNQKSIQLSPNCWVYSTQSKSKFLYPFGAIRIGRTL